MKTIKAIVEAHYSKRDMYGNCYWFMTFTDVKTGKQVSGTISGGESNIYGAMRERFGDSNRFYSQTIEHPIREFNRLQPKLYAGCGSEEINAFITKELKAK